MDAQELLQKVRKIEIKTKGLTRNIFAGEYHSAFKGKGISFSEVREYVYGDDVRDIDWKVTARFNHPYVKVYQEERELTVLLLIDISGSDSFGSVRIKRDFITEIATVLAFSANANNDKVGVILFSDRVEKFIPPKKGRKHILLIIRELLTFKPQSKKTDITAPLIFLTNTIKKRSTVFLISDFFAKDFDTALNIAAHKHDIIALQIYDPRETKLPKIGIINAIDAETGENIWINTNSRRVRQAYEQYWQEHQKQLTATMRKANIDFVSIGTDQDYVRPLIKLFKSR